MKLIDLINEQQARREELLNLQRFIFEDAFNEGEGWVGPNPVEPTTKVEILDGELVKRQFVSEDLLAEVIERHVMGVLSHEPSWTFLGDKGLVKEVEEALTLWWDAGMPMVALQGATRSLTYAKESSQAGEPPRPSVGTLRMFVKSSSVVNGRVPKRVTFEEALNDIGVHSSEPYTSGVIRNLDNDPIVGYYQYVDEANSVITEVNGSREQLTKLELQVPRGDPRDTVVALMTDLGELRGFASYPLSGRLMMFEAQRFPPLITLASIRHQKAINKTLTMMNHNTDVGGFTERTLLNAQMPGHWIDKDGQITTADLGVTFIPEPLRVGAGTTNFYAGLEEVDEEGNIRYARPSITYREPTNPLAFTRTTEALEERLYSSTHQLHIKISGDATASGKSRIQATNDFMSSLQLTAGQVQAMCRWMLSSVVSLGAVLMQEPRKYLSLRPVAEARLSAVQLSSIDIQAVIAKRDAGFISTETGMHEIGVEDVAAEKALILREGSQNNEDGEELEDNTAPANTESDEDNTKDER